eukprot:scaffold234330_cov21-Tisochrysis_lutea.AAC.2
MITVCCYAQARPIDHCFTKFKVDCSAQVNPGHTPTPQITAMRSFDSPMTASLSSLLPRSEATFPPMSTLQSKFRFLQGT